LQIQQKPRVKLALDTVPNGFFRLLIMAISQLLLLNSMLLFCAVYPESSYAGPLPVTATGSNNGQAEQEPVRWLHPEQERWIDEPVFGGSLHLVEAGQDNGQTIVLVHGLGHRGILDWSQVIPRLTDKYHVIAIDLPGFGSSDMHAVQYAPGKYAQLVSWVISRYAHDRAIVIGHSMGGAVSLRFAHDYPEQVSRLVIVDAAGILQRTVFIQYLAKVPVTYEWLAPYQKSIPALDRLIRKLAGKADRLTKSLLVTMDRLPDIPQLMMSSNLAQKYLYKDHSTMNAALGLVYEDFSGVIREVDTPTHIIWGERDDIAPLRTGTVLAGLMPNAELHVVTGAGHVPMTESFAQFMTVLSHSLDNAPIARQAERRLALVEDALNMPEDIRCDGKNGLVYTGRYKNIHMQDCHGIVLSNLVAESIGLAGSEVFLENVKLVSSGTGLEVDNSAVIATLLQVTAEVGITADRSYLDLAGANFVTRDKLVDIREGSTFYFSLSENRHDHQVDLLHGVSLGATFELH